MLYSKEWVEITFISSVLKSLLEEFTYAWDSILCTVNKDFICSSLVLAYSNGSDLHGYLHIGQGSDTQTQVVTWGTFETNYEIWLNSTHSQDPLCYVCFHFGQILFSPLVPPSLCGFYSKRLYRAVKSTSVYIKSGLCFLKAQLKWGSVVQCKMLCGSIYLGFHIICWILYCFIICSLFSLI